MELEEQSIPAGDAKEDKKARKKFIMDFYRFNPQSYILANSFKE
ncbi:hypothetical protein FACS189452_02490 [Bacteroidia bacterium]|nr:hypothetical protein FACS189452_02490 [Bacteroidia bacterium]